MAGYSGTPLARKLGIKEGSGVGLDGSPDGFIAMLDGLPPTWSSTRVCAIDQTWSGLRLVVRRELRAGRETAAG